MKSIGIGIIGVGKMGEFYAGMLASGIPGARLVGLTSHTERRELAESLGVKWFTEYRALLESPDVDLVMICTRTPSHAALSVAAARAGKHVFSEKPLALSLSEADEAIEEAYHNKVKLTVGFMRRFDESYTKVKAQIAQGVIGLPLSFRGVHRSSFPRDWVFEQGGGLVLDYLVHEYDLARWLLGSEVDQVYCVGQTMIHGEKGGSIPDYAEHVSVLMQLDNGATATAEASCLAKYGYDVRSEVFGSNGLCVVGEAREDWVTTHAPDAGARYTPEHSSLRRFENAFRRQVQEFVACVQRNGAPLVTGEDGRAALAVGLAALRSMREGRPVRVSG